MRFVVLGLHYWSILTKDADHKVKEMRLSGNLATQYSKSESDLGNIERYELFLEKLVGVFRKVLMKVENRRYLAIIVSDFRHASDFYPFHSDLYQRLNWLVF